MYKVGICGHFGFGKDLANGQTVKTKNISSELENIFGENQIYKMDSSGGKKALLKLCINAFNLVRKSQNIIMLPAHNGLLIFTPVFRFYNLFFKRKLHYVVIGGWLPEYLEKHRITKHLLKKFDKIYVETSMMKSKLEKQGFNNVLVMPNFKHIKIVENTKKDISKPYKFCTFSRVMYEKGIEHAAKAVCKINSEANETLCTLDIYGPVDNNYKDGFDRLLCECSSCVTYKGCVLPEESTETIKDYYGLLFPTFYSGEGFAGTIIDAFSAGVVVIASDWRYNQEIVKHGKNGLICKYDSLESLELSIKQLIDKKDIYYQMVAECLDSAKKYLPEKVIKILSGQIE